ncbi:hypothetical protein [Micromonospora sp. NPDC050495]|uniref:hypothetical protein n=1 Tax=Micromonospora sp. NPDC050495 TaxID=3154936 RepID=UPI003403FAD6
MGYATGDVITPLLIRPYRATPRTSTSAFTSTSFGSDLVSVSIAGDSTIPFSITAYVPGMFSTVTGDRVEVGIFAAGTQIGGGYVECITGVANGSVHCAEYTPGSSSVTISVRARRAGGTGTCTFYSSNTNPATLWAMPA